MGWVVQTKADHRPTAAATLPAVPKAGPCPKCGSIVSTYLTSTQAAEYLNLSPGTLRSYRSKGFGPGYVRCGRAAIRYTKDALDAWRERSHPNHAAWKATQALADRPTRLDPWEALR